MATKTAALQAKKLAKRKAAAKQKQKKANVERSASSQLLGRREDARMMASIAQGGVGAAAYQEHEKRKRKKQGTEAEELTNKVVMQNITNVLPQIVQLHAGVELFDILAKEKRFELTPENIQVMKDTDERTVQICEDIHAINTLIEAGKTPDDYSEVYMHLVQVLAQIGNDTQPAVIAMLQTQKDLIDQYAHEHRGNMPMFAYQQQLHGLRMLRVGAEYATFLHEQFLEAKEAAAEHAYTPADPMPLDPVETPVLSVEPDLVKDVEAVSTEQPQ
jgi:hypothetical protein